MSTFSLVIQYSNFSDLKERLHDILDELTRNDENVVAASAMPIGELIEFTRDRAFREMGIGFEAVVPDTTSGDAPEQAVEDTPEPTIDLEAFKTQSIDRLKGIYTKKGGAKLIDRLIKKHGGGESLFMKIAADRYPAMMAEVDAEFPND